MTLSPDSPNLLAPSTGLMLATIATLAVVLGLAIYLTVRIARWIRRPAAPTDASLMGGGVQTQLDALASQVHQLDEAQHFVEQLVAKRQTSAPADPRSSATSDS